MRNIMIVLLLGTIVGGCAASKPLPREKARAFVFDQINAAMDIPNTTEDGLRRRVMHYVATGQLAKEPARGAFVGLDEEELEYYRAYVDTFAMDDTKRLYDKYMERAIATGGLEENEKTLYVLYVALDQLWLPCPSTGTSCSAETFRENGKKNAEKMITARGGLLDQLRSDPKHTEAPYMIRYLIMRWDLWDKIPLTEAERVRVATTFLR